MSTTDAVSSERSGARRWGGILAGVSIVGTILASLSVPVLALILISLDRELSGDGQSEWWLLLIAVGLSAASVVGLLVTSRLPVLAYALRLVVLAPVLSLGFVSPWLMLPAAIVASADLSLALSHIRRTLNGPVRWAVAAVTGGVLVVAAVPLTEVGCGRRGDCEYESLLGWEVHESQQLGVWVVVVLLVILVVGLPVQRDEADGLV